MADVNSRDGLVYFNLDILKHLAAVHVKHDAGLERAFESPQKDGLPSIQVGPAEGRLLGLLVQLAGARKVVEVGTLAGYSAIHMARGLAEGGHLWSLEFDAHHAAVARANIAAAGLADRVTVIEGPALETLPQLEAHGPFDVVFLDADKVNYDNYARWATRHLRKGGLLLADNAYLFGHLLDETGDPAAAMRRMHEEASEAYDSVCIPTPDGLMMGIKR